MAKDLNTESFLSICIFMSRSKNSNHIVHDYVWLWEEKYFGVSLFSGGIFKTHTVVMNFKSVTLE